MRLSTRVRYGLRAMIELAMQTSREPMSLHTVAELQSIPPQYLAQLTSALKIARLLESVRGPGGGFRLARPAAEITAWDIFVALDVSSIPVDCLGESECPRSDDCAARVVWGDMADAIQRSLEAHTLEGLARMETEKRGAKAGLPELPDGHC